MKGHLFAAFSSALSIELLAQTLTNLFSLRVILAILCISGLLCLWRRRAKRHHTRFRNDDDWL